MSATSLRESVTSLRESATSLRESPSILECLEIKFHEFYDNMKVIDFMKIGLENLESIIVNNYL